MLLSARGRNRWLGPLLSQTWSSMSVVFAVPAFTAPRHMPLVRMVPSPRIWNFCASLPLQAAIWILLPGLGRLKSLSTQLVVEADSAMGPAAPGAVGATA